MHQRLFPYLSFFLSAAISNHLNKSDFFRFKLLLSFIFSLGKPLNKNIVLVILFLGYYLGHLFSLSLPAFPSGKNLKKKSTLIIVTCLKRSLSCYFYVLLRCWRFPRIENGFILVAAIFKGTDIVYFNDESVTNKLSCSQFFEFSSFKTPSIFLGVYKHPKMSEVASS